MFISYSCYMSTVSYQRSSGSQPLRDPGRQSSHHLGHYTSSLFQRKREYGESCFGSAAFTWKQHKLFPFTFHCHSLLYITSKAQESTILFVQKEENWKQLVNSTNDNHYLSFWLVNIQGGRVSPHKRNILPPYLRELSKHLQVGKIFPSTLLGSLLGLL